MAQFHHHIKSFKRWLKVLNYAESTIYNSPKQVKDFFDYLEATGVKEINETENRHIEEYYEYLKIRPNKRKYRDRPSGALSNNYIISNIGSLKRFSKYLRETEQENLTINIKPERVQTEKIILTKAEIQALYKAIGDDVFGYRDKIMLNIYYGCGLRRNEGLQLNTEDILFKKSLILVREGKGNQQRYVPISEPVSEDLKNYIKTVRNYLIKDKNACNRENALFLNHSGTRIGGTGMITRLKILVQKSGIKKNPSLHTLRHSIATHLLQSGMSLENVSKFLGHKSLEPTQIYTHIINEQ